MVNGAPEDDHVMERKVDVFEDAGFALAAGHKEDRRDAQHGVNEDDFFGVELSSCIHQLDFDSHLS